MEDMMMWLAIGGAIIVMIIAAALLQKKSVEISRLTEELALLRQEWDEKKSTFEKQEKDCEEEIDRVVQSSIQKISHAEQAKEEAVQAAHDNYEVAAQAHILLKEKEALIKELQSG